MKKLEVYAKAATLVFGAITACFKMCQAGIDLFKKWRNEIHPVQTKAARMA